MPFVPVENTALVELRFDYLSQKVENTLWFLFDAAPDVAGLTALGGAIIDWWSGSLQPISNAGVSLREVVVTDMTTASSPSVTVTTGLPLTGDVAEEPLPSNVTLATSFRTTARGRSFRGRNYFIGMSRTQYDGNVALDAFVAALVAAYEQLLDTINTAGTNWVVASRFSGVDPVTKDPIPRADGITSLINAVVMADKRLDSQRRRLAGRGT